MIKVFLLGLIFVLANSAVAQDSCVNFSYYQGSYKKLKKKMRRNKAKLRGQSSHLSLKQAKRRKNFAYQFTSELKVDVPGPYQFFLKSNAQQAILSINGQRVLRAKRKHLGKERSGTITLQPGYHDLEIKYFHRKGQPEINLEYQGGDTENEKIRVRKFNCEESQVVNNIIYLNKLAGNSNFVTAQAVGDGVLDSGEQCDDNNTVSGDGCDSAGNLETGYVCNLEERCGNGVQDYPEVCDDNNLSTRDGCDENCYEEVSLLNFGNESLPLNFNGGLANAVWNKSADNYSVTLPNNVNPKPSFFFSNQGMFADGPVLSVSTRYTSDQDDDYLGFVFGYDVGELNQDPAADYMVLAWKDSDQNFNFTGNAIDNSCPGGVAPAGLRLFRVKGFVGGDELWQIGNCNASAGVITRITDSTIYPSTGYEAAGLPDVKVVYTPSRIQVYLNDVLDINITGTFPASGQYGFYTFAQQGVTFEPLKSAPIAISECIAVCGDGIIVGAESCDDNNLVDGDGCSSFCQTEGGYTCTGQPSSCASTCGDGFVAVSEACDDGNNSAFDGCDDTNLSLCQVETGYACTGSPSTCALTCGDNIDDVGEECDDGNNTDGDGCSAACKNEVAASSTVSFTLGAQTVTESQTTVDVTVRVDQYQSADFVVPVNLLSASSASVNSDYAANTFNFTIPFGQLSKTVTIAILDDPFVEPNETLIFQIDNTSAAIVGTPAQHTITILDDDALDYQNNCVDYTYYQESFVTVDNVDQSPLVASGRSTNFNITAQGPAQNVGYIFRTELQIATAGLYRFWSRSAAGSEIFINGVRVVNNDGLHASRIRRADVTLPAGFANFEVRYFNQTFTPQLEVEYRGPGVTRQIIPGSVLFCQQQAKLEFAVASIDVPEAIGSVSVPIKLSKALPYDLSFEVTVLGSSTAYGTDYNLTTPIVITIPAGELDAQFPVNITNDTLIENGNEFIDFKISVTQGQPGLKDQLRLTIVDDDNPAVGSLLANCITYDYFTGDFRPSVDTIPPSSLDGGCTDSFNIYLRGETNRYGYRYNTKILIGQAGTYTFYTDSGDGSKLFIDNSLVVNNDGVHTTRERSGVRTLTAGYHDLELEYFDNTGGQNLVVLYEGPGILKQQIPSNVLYCDVPELSFTTPSQTVGESIGTATVGVSLNKPAQCNFSASYIIDTSNSSATSNLDYTKPDNRNFQLLRGQTGTSFNVSITDDTQIEPAENILFELARSRYAITGSGNQHDLTITDNDGAFPSVNVAVSPTSVLEHGGINPTVTATLSNASLQAITVTLAFSGTADSGDDFIPQSNQIVVPAGATSASIVINIVDDCPDEADDETIIVSVTNIDNGTAGSTQGGTITIDDGDFVHYENKSGISGTVAISTDLLSSGKFNPATEAQITVADFYRTILGQDATTANNSASALRAGAVARFDNYFGVDVSSGINGDWVLVPFVIPPSPANYQVDRISGLRVGNRGGAVYEVGYSMVALADGAMLGGPWATSVGFPGGLPAPRTASVYYGQYHLRNLHLVCDNGTDLTPAPSMQIDFQSEEPSLGNEFDQVVYTNEITNLSCANCTPDISGIGSERSVRQVLLFPDGDIQRFVSNVITFVP